MYSDNFITHFKKDIQEMFELGYRDKVEIMTEDIMQVELQRRYPGDYDIP